ncbi:MAG: dTDP-4-dehydrorhamnose reductase [Chlamydiae bacterium]|nr:dTDP-4-dehydrorhamnose reductase [Chlamydiota bacterium]
MKFWVVGKDGLLGREMCDFFDKNGVYFVASSHGGADILDEKALLAFYNKHKPSHIVNCAAYVNVDEAEGKGKELAYLLNVEGPKNLTRLAKKEEIRLLHIGTDYVFDGEKKTDYTETDETNPINEYGRTKLLGEREVICYEKGLCLRTASIYGKSKPGIISGMIDAVKSKEVVQHISDQISTPTYAKDLAEAIFQIRDQSGLFHFTNEGSVSRYELLLYVWHLVKELGLDVKCREVKAVLQKDCSRAAKRPLRSVLSNKKIEKFLQKPIRKWEEALREYVEEIC